MNYKLLGKSDLKISEVGLGCMSLSPKQSESEHIIWQAIEAGINYFDTADLYDKGANEELLGRALRGVRKEHIIATKVGNEWKADGSGWQWNPSREHILRSVEGSLQRLQTDYIDLYQLHGGTIEDPIDETIEAFELLQQQGKIRYYGISSIRPNVIREYIKRSKIVSVMMQYSLLDRRPEEECLSLLHENNIGVLARGSVAQGLLLDKQAKPYLEYSQKDVEKAATAVHFVAGERRTAAQTAVGYVLKNNAVTAAVVGARTSEQLHELIPPADLTDREWNFLRDTIKPTPYRDHR